MEPTAAKALMLRAVLTATAALVAWVPAGSLAQPAPAPVPAPVPAGAPTTAPATTRPVNLVARPFPGTRLSVTVPDSWKRLRVISGWGDPSRRFELGAVELPFASADAFTQLGPGGPLVEGYTIDAREEVRIEGRDALLVRGWRNAEKGRERRMWLAFGTSRECVLVIAGFRLEDDAELTPLVRNAMLSVRWELMKQPDGAQRLPFTFTLPEGMFARGSVGERVVYSVTPKEQRPREGEPAIIAFVTRADSDGAMSKEEALKRAEAVKGTKTGRILETTAVKYGGLPGFESVIEVDDPGRGRMVTVYLLSLQDEGAQYHLMCQAADGEVVRFLPAFKAAGRSVRLKPEADLAAGR